MHHRPAGLPLSTRLAAARDRWLHRLRSAVVHRRSGAPAGRHGGRRGAAATGRRSTADRRFAASRALQFLLVSAAVTVTVLAVPVVSGTDARQTLASLLSPSPAVAPTAPVEGPSSGAAAGDRSAWSSWTAPGGDAAPDAVATPGAPSDGTPAAAEGTSSAADETSASETAPSGTAPSGTAPSGTAPSETEPSDARQSGGGRSASGTPPADGAPVDVDAPAAARAGTASAADTAPAPSSSTAAPARSATPSPVAGEPAAPSTTAPAGGEDAVLAPADAERAVLALVNAERAEQGCAPVVADAGLAGIARAHSADMRDRGFFDHRDPDGRSPSDRAARAGVPGVQAENIAVGPDDAATVMRVWLDSPDHRAAILDCELGTLGVGVADGPGGPWWTQLFAG
ncbi:CAP domain-containing protein [Geodermatophilus sp. YIM 151500]|uniref:CAP domain-containing protein n=1 Tax=Geodermatophilus sp. YIM 151500 TaxID=2984531 RepID=UPI0021E37E85|nr:CAP domain-containing protein [Geodermatophilus sp. YIM 151500]MCV2488489.1 CAP domain-containing protein [Geodermatophilus sp. YIM 151500]